jgi:hypothetical protein
MSEAKPIDINLVELATLSSNILQQILIKAPKNKAKPLFKDLKAGKAIALGSITLAEKLELPLKMDLDYSEFRGPGFNLDALKMSVETMLHQVMTRIRAKQDLNVMTSETGTALLHLPGAIQINEQTNVLVMAFDIGQAKQITLKLMYVDPTQYDQFKTEQK